MDDQWAGLHRVAILSPARGQLHLFFNVLSFKQFLVEEKYVVEYKTRLMGTDATTILPMDWNSRIVEHVVVRMESDQQWNNRMTQTIGKNRLVIRY